MLTQEIMPGDEFYQMGELIYTVEHVTVVDSPAVTFGDYRDIPGVYAEVRYYIDGGTALRSWDLDKEIPLVRS